MASDYSIRFRLNYQAPGDNLNLWGIVLNAGVFQMLEDAIAKRLAFTLSGTKTLTTVNGAADEARCAYLDVTGGTGGTIVTPEVEKWYIVHNGASGQVTVTADAGGADVVVNPGDTVFTVCDGVNFRKIQASSFDGARLTALGDPVDAQDAATRAYVDAQAWNGQAGILPAQSGAAGKFLGTNGSAASWSFPVVASISDYGSDQAARAEASLAAATARAIAFSLLF